MATTDTVNGTKFGVYVTGTLIAGGTDCELSVTHDPRDTTTKDDAGWETSLEGKRSWSVKTNGMVAFDASGYDYEDLRLLQVNRTKVEIKFSTDTSGDKYYKGDAYLSSVTLNAPVEGSVTYSADFKGTGTLTVATKT